MLQAVRSKDSESTMTAEALDILAFDSDGNENTIDRLYLA